MNLSSRYPPTGEPKLHDRVRAELRKRHYSRRTEEAYIGWIRNFIRHHGIRHPREMGKEEVEGFLSHLAVGRKVAAATQNQALAALLFLYRDVLGVTLEWLDNVVRAKKPARLPVVLTRKEVMAVLSRLHGPNRIAGMLMYGAGLRLLECLQLRIKDIDFGYCQIVVREGKGNRDRITILPSAVEDRLKLHLEEVKTRHEKDLKGRAGYVMLPGGLERKYLDANRQWIWQWVFPATRHFQDPASGRLYRHHLHETVLQKTVKEADSRAGLAKRITCHTFRHNADSRIMPTRESRGRWNRGIPRICHCCRRHNQRDSRKASSLSPGLYHPDFTPMGVVLERASCFNRRSAWRYICVVSTDS